jgi:hypothetical protein
VQLLHVRADDECELAMRLAIVLEDITYLKKTYRLNSHTIAQPNL